MLSLNAAAPGNGEGTWSILDGSADFSDVNDPNTTITNFSPGIFGTLVLKWQISDQCHSGLPTAEDILTININQTSGPAIILTEDVPSMIFHIPIPVIASFAEIFMTSALHSKWSSPAILTEGNASFMIFKVSTLSGQTPEVTFQIRSTSEPGTKPLIKDAGSFEFWIFPDPLIMFHEP